MSEVTEYVANALLRVNRPRGVFIKRYFYQQESRANIELTVQIHPGDMLPDWVHDDEIQALRDGGLIAPRGSSVVLKTTSKSKDIPWAVKVAAKQPAD